MHTEDDSIMIVTLRAQGYLVTPRGDTDLSDPDMAVRLVPGSPVSVDLFRGHGARPVAHAGGAPALSRMASETGARP